MRCRMYDFVYTTDLGEILLVYRQDRHRIRESELRPTPVKLVVYSRRYNHRRSLCQLGEYGIYSVPSFLEFKQRMRSSLPQKYPLLVGRHLGPDRFSCFDFFLDTNRGKQKQRIFIDIFFQGFSLLNLFLFFQSIKV